MFDIQFSWVVKLIDRCHERGTLLLDDLYDLLPEFESKTLTDRFEANWLAEVQRSPNQPSLWRSTASTIGYRMIVLILLLLARVNQEESYLK